MRGKFNAGCFVSISDFLRAFVIDFWAFGSSAGKESASSAADPSSIPGSGRSGSPGEGKGYPLLYSGLENSMDYSPWDRKRVRHDWATFTSPSDILGLPSWCNGKESTCQCHFQWQLSDEVFCSIFLSMPDMGMGLTGGASGKEPACQCRRLQRCRFDPWMGKIPWRRQWQPTPVFLPGKFHGQRCLVDCSPWSHKESDTTECAHARVRTHTHTHTHTHTEQAFYQHFKVYLNCILVVWHVVHGSVLRKCLKYPGFSKTTLGFIFCIISFWTLGSL